LELSYQTFDAWDDVLYIAMYGCDEYPYYDVLNHNENTKCSNPFAFGWLAPLVLLPLGIIGSYILPPILIGIVTMKVSSRNSFYAVTSFEKTVYFTPYDRIVFKSLQFGDATKYIEESAKIKKEVACVMEAAREDLDHFFTPERVEV